ncbi:spheroidene monooxygenase [Rhodocytophaga rosea]|uniref:Spheroidene monooxygenase n=1 Tax=Rhodocytophaga rosea TaxID=2704465 RepID=A0A6C0GPE4_9BACT|nr:spheroidene monooxygenase [Rhodocytophaga rosea]QHT69787.1 spheroidene monooxygenase [Rhodocytophaga rosea]
MMANKPIVTITFFRFSGLAKLWALQQMQLAAYSLNHLPGLQFYKLLGSGYGSGFSMRPDFSTFALLCNWTDDQAAHQGLYGSHILQKFKKESDEQWTIYMHTLASHGRWSGMAPFGLASQPQDSGGVIAVLTRASLHFKHLIDFWKHVPSVSQAIQDNPHLIFTKGIGEVPLIHQATFSLWTSQQDMMAFAYQNPFHTEVIRKTREMGWYKEELFARFKPFHSEGTWQGQDPLATYLSPHLDEKAS